NCLSVPEEDVDSVKIERNARQWESSLMPSVLWSEICDCGRGNHARSGNISSKYFAIAQINKNSIY
ncbi:MAG: hypothetical protein K8R06_04110, partial [Methanosarcinales archaeon]|nr:hypothetical protein [Methanosarcinales archaeon]